MSASRGTKGEVTWSTCSRNVAQSLDKDCLRDNDGGPSEWNHMDKYDNRPGKVEIFVKGDLDLIPSPSPSMKIQIMSGKVCLRCKGKILLVVVHKLLKTKLTMPSNVLLLLLRKIFPLII